MKDLPWWQRVAYLGGGFVIAVIEAVAEMSAWAWRAMFGRRGARR